MQKAKLEEHKELKEFLKSQHNFTHGFANFVELKARKSDAASNDENELVANQYKGKENVKPIYENLVAKILKI